MVCVACSRTGDSVAHDEVAHALADAHDDTGARVSQGLRRIQAVDHGSVGGKRSLLTNLPQDLADKVWPAAGLAQEGLLREVHGDFLGSRRDHGEVILNENLPGSHGGGGHFKELKLPTTGTLKDLFHAVTSLDPVAPGTFLSAVASI